MQQYFVGVHPVAYVLQRSLLQRRYEAFWEYRSQDNDVPAPLLALISSVMFSAFVSLNQSRLDMLSLEQTSIEFLNTLQRSTELALTQAECLQTSNLETLQSLVIYLVCLLPKLSEFTLIVRTSYVNLEANLRFHMAVFFARRSRLQNVWVYIVMLVFTGTRKMKSSIGVPYGFSYVSWI